MSEHGTALGVRMAALWRGGGVYLPKIAGDFLVANTSLAGSTDDAAVFAQPATAPATPGLPTTDYGQVYPAWTRVRDELQRMLGESATNCYETGDALIRIAQLYEAADGEAGDRMRAELSKFQAGGDQFESPGQHRAPVMPPQEYRRTGS